MGASDLGTVGFWGNDCIFFYLGLQLVISYTNNHVNMTIVICPRDILESVQNLLCTVTHSEPSSFLVYVRSDFDL